MHRNRVISRRGSWAVPGSAQAAAELMEVRPGLGGVGRAQLRGVLRLVRQRDARAAAAADDGGRAAAARRQLVCIHREIGAFGADGHVGRVSLHLDSKKYLDNSLSAVNSRTFGSDSGKRDGCSCRLERPSVYKPPLNPCFQPVLRAQNARSRQRE
jgi:hypothetical protein